MRMLRAAGLIALGMGQAALIASGAVTLMRVTCEMFVAEGLADEAHRRERDEFLDALWHSNPDCAHPVVFRRGLSSEDHRKEFNKLFIQAYRCPAPANHLVTKQSLPHD